MHEYLNEYQTGECFARPTANKFMDVAGRLNEDVSCGWVLDHDEFAWDTGCGHVFILNNGTPKENDMVFCPFCGNKIDS